MEPLIEFERIVQEAQNQHLLGIDPYITSGYQPSENDLSRALHRLLNPREPNTVAEMFLPALVEAIRSKIGQKADLLLEAISSDLQTPNSIFVKPETPARVDISVVGKRFIIFVENKICGGCERQSQTEKQQGALTAWGKEHGIPESCLVGIYLSPEGNSANDPNYVPLRTRDLAEAFRKALRNRTQFNDETDAASARQTVLLKSFVETYDALNGGGTMKSDRIQWYIRNFRHFSQIDTLRDQICRNELPDAVMQLLQDVLEKDFRCRPPNPMSSVKFTNGREFSYGFLNWCDTANANLHFGIHGVSGWSLTEAQPPYGPYLYAYIENVGSREALDNFLESISQFLERDDHGIRDMPFESRRSPIWDKAAFGYPDGQTGGWAYCAVSQIRDIVNMDTLMAPDQIVVSLQNRARRFTEALLPVMLKI